jgi:hypothetical protein
VSILEAADSIVARRGAEVSRVELAPRAGQIGCFEIAREKRALELEADHDVDVIGQLVGLNANEARLHMIDDASERLE